MFLRPYPLPRTLLIVPADQQAAANAAAAAAAGPYAAGTFTKQFSRGGQRYFVACWDMAAETLTALRTALGAGITTVEGAGREKLDQDGYTPR
jgi:hypothetical protein